jgi:hypothetical protein
MKRLMHWCSTLAVVVLVAFALPAAAQQKAAQQKNPNILIIWATTSATGTSAPTTTA